MLERQDSVFLGESQRYVDSVLLDRGCGSQLRCEQGFVRALSRDSYHKWVLGMRKTRGSDQIVFCHVDRSAR